MCDFDDGYACGIQDLNDGTHLFAGELVAHRM
jgi:hypothetical protein